MRFVKKENKKLFLVKLWGTCHLKRYADKLVQSQHDLTQIQISFLNLSIETFVLNNENARKEIVKFIIQFEQPF